MRHLLNTLYLNLDGAYLARDGENIDIRLENKSIRQFPIHIFESIVCFGRISVSPGAMKLCADNGIVINFLSAYGRFIVRITGPTRGNVLLRRRQYRWADDEEKCEALARAFIAAKIANSRTVLQRQARERQSSAPFGEAIQGLGSYLYKLKEFGDDTRVRTFGSEGDSAALYFNCFDHMILVDKEAFFFNKRTRRPPLDRVNALLSLGYSLLASDVASALESVGLDPYVGFLHRDRPGRVSLALDLMEELRAPIVDRFVVALINRRQIDRSDFQIQENGAVLLSDEARKSKFLTLWQTRKQEEITHPFLQEKIPLGLLPYVQSMLLARVLRGDLDEYPPFFLK